MNTSGLIFIGVLVLAWLFLKIAPKLFVRQVARAVFSEVGKRAMGNAPEQITFSRADAPQWKDENAMQQQATPLVRAGFQDLGTYVVDKMPGAVIRILFQPQTYVSVQVCEHPKVGSWAEFATRYTDGSSDYLSTLPDQGITPPPFARTARAARGTPADVLYQQHLTQRQANGIQRLSPNDVIRGMEDAYMRYMIWKNNKGLTPEEVAQVALKWAKAKKQAAGQ